MSSPLFHHGSHTRNRQQHPQIDNRDSTLQTIEKNCTRLSPFNLDEK